MSYFKYTVIGMTIWPHTLQKCEHRKFNTKMSGAFLIRWATSEKHRKTWNQMRWRSNQAHRGNRDKARWVYSRTAKLHGGHSKHYINSLDQNHGWLVICSVRIFVHGFPEIIQWILWKVPLCNHDFEDFLVVSWRILGPLLQVCTSLTWIYHQPVTVTTRSTIFARKSLQLPTRLHLSLASWVWVWHPKFYLRRYFEMFPFTITKQTTPCRRCLDSKWCDCFCSDGFATQKLLKRIILDQSPFLPRWMY